MVYALPNTLIRGEDMEVLEDLKENIAIASVIIVATLVLSALLPLFQDFKAEVSWTSIAEKAATISLIAIAILLTAKQLSEG